MLSGNDLELPETAEDWTNRAYVIGIAGGTASGKTTLSNRIKKELHQNIAVLSFDSFYHNVDPNVSLDDFDFDHPSSIDFDNAFQCLLALRNLKTAHAPVYSFVTNSRIEGQTELIEPKRFVIVEGIFAFYDERLRSLMDIRIFIHCDTDIALSRRVLRDINERGREALQVLKRYNKFVRDDFHNYIKPYMKYADIIIPGGAENNIGFKFILDNLKNHEKEFFDDISPHFKKAKNTRVIKHLVFSQKDVNKQFPSSVIYCYDSLNSHSTLLLEGLMLKYTHEFFKSALSIWSVKLHEKHIEKIETDFQSPYEELREVIEFCTLEEFIEAQALPSAAKQSVRAKILVIPFLFAEVIEPHSQKLQKSAKKAQEPIYILAIIADIESVRKVLNINPLIRVIMLFCIESEAALVQHVKLDSKAAKIEHFNFSEIIRSVSARQIIKLIQ